MASLVDRPARDARPATEPPGRSVLAGLRRRIRTYVLAEGVLAVVAWTLGVFYAALALDYLPVRLGADELPFGVRVAILLVALVGAAVVLWRYIGRRIFRPLTDASLALLVERSHRQFGDSLVTSVELAREPAHAAAFDPALLDRTVRDATTRLADVRLGTIFNAAPVGRKAMLAGGLIAGTVVFGLVAPAALATGVSRLLLLSGDLWPRSARIEVVGLRLVGGGREADGFGGPDAPSGEPSPADPPAAPSTGDEGGPVADAGLPSDANAVLAFSDRTIRLARGASAALLVRADTTAPAVPRQCVLRYQTSDGGSGWTYLRQDGSPRDGWQAYSYDGKPFRTITGSVTFSVTGDDHRLSGYRIEVVEPPAVIGTEVACVYPRYLVDEATGRFLPRTIRYGAGLTIPVGTAVTLRCRTNKPLSKVVAAVAATTPAPGADGPDGGAAGDPAGPTVQTLAASGTTFEVPLGTLAADTTVRLRLTDADGVTARESERLVLVAEPDRTPELDLRLAGIGTAVTPDVRLPVTGRLADDHGLARTWFEATVNEQPARTIEFPPPVREEAAAELDFRAMRTGVSDPLRLAVGGRLTVQVRAADRYDLFGRPPQVGSADPWAFDVVSPEELLRRLELVEAGYRKRLEQVLEEMTQTRDELVRVKFDAIPVVPPRLASPRPDPPTAPPADASPADVAPAGPAVPEPTPDPAPVAPTLDERQQTLRALRVQQGALQAAKSAGEVRGLAEAFLALRQELENNRVDAEERRQRLDVEVGRPLAQVADGAFPELGRRLAALEAALTDPQLGLAEATAAVEQADAILVALDGVLQKLIKFEGYSELLEIVRSILGDQQDLERQTREERERQAIEALLE